MTALGVLLIAGCATPLRHAAQHEVLWAQSAQPLDGYQLGCADVLEVSFSTHPEWDCAAVVDLDGCLPLGAAGRPHVQGLTLPAAHALIAEKAKVEPETVQLSLAQLQAKQIYLSGPVNNIRRVVPYVGPEPVVHFLQRAGAYQPNCTDVREITIIREHVARGGTREVFHVNWEAVLRNEADASNIILEPSDQVVVGETKRSVLSRSVPEWFRPSYERLVGMTR